MLIVRSATHGEDQARVFVTDPLTGDTVSGVTSMAISHEIVGAVRSGQSHINLDYVRNRLGIKEPEDLQAAINKARDRHGINVLEDGTVDMGNGVLLPDSFRRMLLSVTDDRDIKSVIRFGKKLAKNPLPHAREALVEWIIRNPSLALTNSGNVVGYRGLRKDFTSIHSGYGIVNGVHLANANLDNTPGNVIEFPREMIDHNPNKHCSVGLHVGTWGYASGFSQGRIVMVTFSPTDVVSPPTDSAQEKIRVCKMISRAEINSALPEDTVVFHDIDDEIPEDLNFDDHDDDDSVESEIFI